VTSCAGSSRVSGLPRLCNSHSRHLDSARYRKELITLAMSCMNAQQRDCPSSVSLESLFVERMQQKSGRNVARHQQRLESNNVGERSHCRPIMIATDRLCPLEQWSRGISCEREEASRKRRKCYVIDMFLFFICRVKQARYANKRIK
jgi:hypothetical protein